MLKTTLSALGAAVLLATTASAQNCSDNLQPLTLVDAAGTAFPRAFDSVIGENAFSAPSEVVYLAFPTTLASGTYYVHVTDTPIDGLDEVVSSNDPLDRFVAVTNTAGVITLALPFSTNPNPPAFGAGLGGQGQSLRLEFHRSQYSACRFKAWFGDKWDLANGPTSPYLIAGGVQPSGACVVRSYESFKVGSGAGSDVTGVVFADGNRNGARDSGEAGISGRTVRLVTGSTTTSATTDSGGAFVFHGVVAGAYTVEMVVPSGQTATTPSSRSITVAECANLAVTAFGTAAQLTQCHGRPTCHWTGCHGRQRAESCGALWSTGCLNLVDRGGRRVAPCTQQQLCSYLEGASTWNMAHALSCELLAMHCAVMSGDVSPWACVRDRQLGTCSIGELMQRAATSLQLCPQTLQGHPQRGYQDALRRVLDDAGNNRNWQ